ncbi:MAG TPA: class I SAM-dependent methyltransferase [Gemmatimonadaceae bacterium]|nr:class I SAM-dependent methyltransferase [Gemmatimonadaceae bacterium]
MIALPARDAYRLWAPSYPADTAVTFLEDRLVAALAPPPAGQRLLDVGCGTGRRLGDAGAAFAVGLDLVPEMLARAGGVPSLLAAADVRALPVATGAFDVVWCRLVVGYVAELERAYAELARVCRVGGTVLVTEFHPDAVAAGHRRTFRDSAGALHEIASQAYAPDEHERAARAAGLEQAARLDGAVGPEVRGFYERAGKLEAYEAQRGLPIVLALAFRRRP